MYTILNTCHLSHVIILLAVVAEFDISPDLWFFECHFPGNPIMPGCLGLDGLWQLTGFKNDASFFLLGISTVFGCLFLCAIHQGQMAMVS